MDHGTKTLDPNRQGVRGGHKSTVKVSAARLEDGTKQRHGLSVPTADLPQAETQMLSLLFAMLRPFNIAKDCRLLTTTMCVCVCVCVCVCMCVCVVCA